MHGTAIDRAWVGLASQHCDCEWLSLPSWTMDNYPTVHSFVLASGYFAVSWIPLSTTYDTLSVSVFCTADLLQLHTLGHRLRYDKIQRLSLTLKVWCFNRYNRWFAAQTVVLLLCRLITSIMSRQQWWWHNNVSYVMVAYDTLTLAMAGAVLSSTRYDYSRPIQ